MKLDEIIINDEVSKELVGLYSQKSVNTLFAPIVNLGIGNTILQEKLIEKIDEIKRELNKQEIQQEIQQELINQSRKNVLKLFNKIERKILKRKDNYFLFDDSLISDNFVYSIKREYLEVIIADKKIKKEEYEITSFLENVLLKLYFKIEKNHLKLDTIYYNNNMVKELFRLIVINQNLIFMLINEQMNKEIIRNFNILRLTRSLMYNEDFESDDDLDGDSDCDSSEYQLINRVINVNSYIMNDLNDYYKKILLLKDSLELEEDYILNIMSIENLESVKIKYGKNYDLGVFDAKK